MLNEEKLNQMFASIQEVIEELKAQSGNQKKEELSEQEKFDIMSDFFSKFLTLAYEHNITKHHDLHTIILLTVLKHYVLVSQHIAKEMGILDGDISANEEVKKFVLSQSDTLKGCIDAFFNSIHKNLESEFLDDEE
jgi:Na+/phosphate symporter